jgi:Domain of unknown function (DUF4917)
VQPSSIDGSLASWAEIADAEDWQSLLLGNGLSINVWPNFVYDSLLDYARDDHLTDDDRSLFNGTANFERVLADLNAAIRTCERVGIDTAPLFARYRSIQLALGHAIREVHLERSRVPDTTLETIRGVLEQFEWVFTTSYDLLVYWAMGYGGRFEPFVDCLRWGGRCEFDPEKADVYVGQIPIYFLHGALHLVVGGSGVTWKLRHNSIHTLLDQFGQPIEGDPQARTLLVTEGSSHEKLRAIESNSYLAHALDRLRDCALPTIVFGSSLSEQDRHLADALNEHAKRPIAVSMLPGRKRDLAIQQADIYGRLEAETLLFFDATTHPLGQPRLAATGDRARA